MRNRGMIEGNKAGGAGGGDLLSTNNLSDVANAATSFSNIKQAATTDATGVVELATDGEAAADKVVQGNDSRLSAKDFIDYAASPMIVTGGEITEGTNAGTFKVAALTALIRKTDSVIGELAYVTKTEEDNIAITLADTRYYVVINYNGGTPTVSIITDLQAFNDEIPIGSVMKNASNEVTYISGCYRLQDGVAKLHYRAFELYNLYLANGNIIAYSGTNNFTMTAGVIYEGINRLTQAAYNSAVTTFRYIYKNGSGGWTTTAPVNVIDFAHYDDEDGVLGEIGTSKWGCHWVYRNVDDDDVYVLYGRNSYSLTEATAAGLPDGPDHLTQFGCLIGKIIAPQAGGSFALVQMVTDTVFTGVSVATHNDLGGLNDGDYKHLTAAEYTALTLGAAATSLNVTLSGFHAANARITGNITGVSGQNPVIRKITVYINSDPGANHNEQFRLSLYNADEHTEDQLLWSDYFNLIYQEVKVETVGGGVAADIDLTDGFVKYDKTRFLGGTPETVGITAITDTDTLAITVLAAGALGVHVVDSGVVKVYEYTEMIQLVDADASNEIHLALENVGTVLTGSTDILVTVEVQ